MITLFLNENPLPPKFTRGTIAAKELRLRAALPYVDQVHVIARRGQTVALADSRVGELEKKIHVHLLPPWPYYLAGILLFVYGCYYCYKLKPTVVEAESPIISGPVAVMLDHVFNTNSIVEVRSTFSELIKHKLKFIPYQFKKKLLNLVQFNTLKHATAVIANSEYYYNQLKQLGIPSTIINPGLQYLPTYQPSTISHNSSTLVIGYLGRLAPEKGPRLLIEAVKTLLNQPLTINHQPLSLLIAGDGPQKNELEQLASRYPLVAKHLHFLGFQPNYQFLNTIDILVNPCLVSAPLEMVNVEAAALGVPVICFGDDQQPETVIHKQTGLIVRQKTATALAKALKQLIENSDVRQQMSLAGPKLAKQYSFESQVNALDRLYQSLLPPHNRHQQGQQK